MPPYRVLALACAAVILTACAGPSRQYRAGLNARISAYDFNGAIADLEAAKRTEYSEKNAVLYYLDRGMLLHQAARYADSDTDLENAETRMEELYTKSVSRRAATLVLNDNTTKYPGEIFERALTNVFRALNFVFLGMTDSALVEARKVTAWLARYRDFMEGKSGYADSAFAQYLSGLLFEASGEEDDARIAFAAADKAFPGCGAGKPSFSVPEYRDLARLGLGEIIFLHYNGPAPMKLSRTFQVAWNEAMLAVNESRIEDPEEASRFANAVNAGLIGDAITVSYPEYVQDPYQISASAVSAGEIKAQTQLMEDISFIARRTLEEKNASIRLRAIARATVKFVLARKASGEVEKRGGAGLGFLAKIAASAVAAATEVADTRGWVTLPAQIRMARLALPAGAHDLNITFYRQDGSIDGTAVFRGVQVQKGSRKFLHYRTAR